MKNINFFTILLMTFFVAVGLTACSSDAEPKDTVNEIRMQVADETGVMYDLFDDKMENPIECMLVQSEDFPGKNAAARLE